MAVAMAAAAPTGQRGSRSRSALRARPKRSNLALGNGANWGMPLQILKEWNHGERPLRTGRDGVERRKVRDDDEQARGILNGTEPLTAVRR
jgi:hypothetical protein